MSAASHAPIFFDLDGSILDPSGRYYRLHSDILAEIGLEILDAAEFWRRKRERAKLPAVVHPQAISEANQATYWQRWHAQIEEPSYLALDRVIPGAREQLVALSSRHPLILVTLRRRLAPLMEQLATLELTPLFREVRTGFPEDERDTVAFKQKLIRDSADFDPRGWVVGDTEVDIRAGKGLGLCTVAVESGLRTAELLRREEPDLLLHDLTELSQVLGE